MAQLTRALQKVFGSAGGTSEFGQIGSKAAGATLATKDIELMQALTEYDDGMSAIVSDQGTTKIPYLQDINSLFYLTTAQLAYLMQSGVPEWNDETEYYADDSIVLFAGNLYKDVYGTGGTPNLNFSPDSNPDKWKLIASITDVAALSDGANISTDCALGNVFTVTKAVDGVLDNPINKLVGKEYTWVITQDPTGGWNLTFDTHFLFPGRSEIRTGANEKTIIKGVVLSSTLILCQIIEDSFAVGIDSKNLTIDIVNNSQISCAFESLRLTDSNNIPSYIFNDSVLFDTASHLQGPELISTYYRLWIDRLKNLKIVPDLTGTADSDVLNSLSASGALFQTYGVSENDEVYNLDAQTKGYVKAVSSEILLTCKDKNGADIDLFPNGNENFKIIILNPAGLDSTRDKIGLVYNDSSSNFTLVRKDVGKTFTESFWYGQNGYGASSTAIQKFTTEGYTINNGILGWVSNTTNLGFETTIVKNCICRGVWSGNYSGVNGMAFSLNSTALSTPVQSITISERLTPTTAAVANNTFQCVCPPIKLKPGDKLRLHSGQNADGSGASQGSVYILLEED